MRETLGFTNDGPVSYWGRFITTARIIEPATQPNAVANRAFISPFYIPRKMGIDKILVRILTLVGNARVGIYSDNGDTPVGGKLLFDTGSTALSKYGNNPNDTIGFYCISPQPPNVGSLSQALSTPTPQATLQLAQGLYWVAFMTDTANPQFYRMLNISELPDPFNGSFYNSTIGFAFVDPCPAVTADNTISPNVLFRVAQVYE